MSIARIQLILIFSFFVNIYLCSTAYCDNDTAASDKVDINLENGTLEQIIALYADLSGRTPLRASNLPSPKIVLQGKAPFTKEDAISAIQSVLIMNGLTIVDSGDKFFKVLPLDKFKAEGVPFKSSDTKSASPDQLMSQIFELKYLDYKEILPVIQSMMHSYAGTPITFPRTNTFIITETASNLAEISKIIEKLDRPIETTIVTRFYRVNHAKASDVANQLNRVIATVVEGGSGINAISSNSEPEQPNPSSTVVNNSQADSAINGKVTVSADDLSNQIIVITKPSNLSFVEQLIKNFDIDLSSPLASELKVLPLKYADASDLAGLLEQILGQGGITKQSNKPRVGDSKNPYASRASITEQVIINKQETPIVEANSSKKANISIYPDTRTNSLIVMGSTSDIEWIRNFIKDVDVLLPQVLLEGLVVEVGLNKTDTFGVEVLAREVNGQASQAIFSHTLSTNPLDAATIASAATLPAGLPSGLNYFVSLRNTKMDVIVQALSQSSNARILSQPIIQTSHNKEANIVVAEARPIVTETSANLQGNQSSLRSNVEYKDIGLEMTVRPIVNPDGMVVMDILQRVDNITGFTTIDNNQVPVISRRQASSVVSVLNGETIILGGLVSNSETRGKAGIPFLSDIPILGYLFGSTTKANLRTELLVLLKPTVLRTPQEASEEAYRRRKALEEFQKRKLTEEIDKIEGRPDSKVAEPFEP